MTSVLRARGLRIDGRLQSTDVEIAAGELVGVIGPNGGGKTSLIRAIADVEGSADVLEIAGEPSKTAPPARRPSLIGFLPASRDVVWPISVESVITLGLAAPNPQKVSAMLALFELESLRSRPINSLSTGERSRALLARACVSEPHLLLLDEPLSNMDPYWALRTIDIVGARVRDRGTAALIALHDLNQAEAFDRLLFIHKGRILLNGSPAEVLESLTLQESYRVERHAGRWRIRRSEDPQSLP
jgi:iron complex transport system ATP-binding protein